MKALKISNEQVKQVLQGYVRQVEGKKAGKVKADNKKAGGLNPKDSVTITARSKEAEKAKELFEKLPEVRSDLVNDLKEKVKSGDYKVTSKEVADKIIHRTVVDKSV